MTIFIYSLIDPRNGNIKYIGRTNNLTRRFSRHCRDFSEPCHRTNWLKQLRSLNLRPVMQIIEACDESNWAERETYWIVYGRKQGWPLTNLTNGGDGFVSLFRTETHKRKISESLKGKKNFLGKAHTEEYKTRSSERVKGDKNPFYGKRHTADSLQKMSVANKGERNNSAKLTEAEVKEIKDMLNRGMTQTKIAHKYGVSQAVISSIKIGKTWGWVK